MSTLMKFVISVEDEGEVRSLRLELPLDEHLQKGAQGKRMREALDMVRFMVLSCLKTAVAQDVLGWRCPDVAKALELMPAEDLPEIGEMVRLRYPGYEAEVRQQGRLVGGAAEE